MTKVTPEEIVIIKRIAAIESIDHKVTRMWNAETEQDEDYDCFSTTNRSARFEWCARYDSFDDFIREYTQYNYDSGYQAGCW